MRAFNSLGANPATGDAVARTRHIAKSSHRAGRADITELKSITLFARVAENDLKEVVEISTVRSFEPRSVFVEENGECEYLFIVLEGTVALFSGFDEQETIIDIAQPGGVLHLPSVMAELPYAVGANTLSDARLIAIPAAAIRRLFDRDRAFACVVAAELSRASCRMIAELTSLKTRTSIARLATWLMQNSDEGGRFRLPFGKRTLASRLGMTPECLSRSLRSLSKYGVHIHGREIMVVNRTALATFAGAPDLRHVPYAPGTLPRQPSLT